MAIWFGQLLVKTKVAGEFRIPEFTREIMEMQLNGIRIGVELIWLNVTHRRGMDSGIKTNLGILEVILEEHPCSMRAVHFAIWMQITIARFLCLMVDMIVVPLIGPSMIPLR